VNKRYHPFPQSILYILVANYIMYYVPVPIYYDLIHVTGILSCTDH